MSRVRNDVRTWPGPKREARMVAELTARNRMPQRWRDAVEKFTAKVRNPIGLKRWFVPGSEYEGAGVLTEYANKTKARRRRRESARRESRRRNRCLAR